MSIMMIGIVIKTLGFVRSLVIASQFGSGETTDAFFLALSLVGILTSLFGGALGQTVVPILVEIKHKEGDKAKDRHMSNIINIFTLVSVIIIVILWFLGPYILRLMAKNGFTEEQFELTVTLLRIGLPTLLLYNVAGLYKGYLHAEQIFVVSEVANLPYNIIYIVYLLAFGSVFGIKGLMAAHVFAVFSQLILPLFTAFKKGYHHSAVLEPRDKYLIKSFHLILPVFMGIAINDLNVFIDKSMASRLVAGSISALTYGDKLNTTVQQLFVAALSVVIFPMISKAYQEGNRKLAIETVQRGIDLVLLVVVPITLAIVVLHEPVTKFFFERGEFTATATAMTSRAMFFYSLSLPAASIKVLLLKLSYASMDMRLPFLNSLLSLILNFILNLVFIGILGHAGLALATSLSSFITLFLLIWGLRMNDWFFDLRKNLLLLSKTLLSASVMALVIYGLKLYAGTFFGESLIQQFLALAVYGIVGLLVYIVGILILKTEEISELLDLFKKKA